MMVCVVFSHAHYSFNEKRATHAKMFKAKFYLTLVSLRQNSTPDLFHSRLATLLLLVRKHLKKFFLLSVISIWNFLLGSVDLCSFNAFFCILSVA